MSVGEFLVQGYHIRYLESVFTIHTTNQLSITFRVGVLPFGNVEALDIQIHSPLHATIETSQSLMRLIYYEDENDPNGQIELAVKTPDGNSSWTTLVNSVPRSVIVAVVAILSGDDDVEQYRVRRNNEANANDPEAFAEPGGNLSTAYNNGSTNVTSNSNSKGGKRRRSTRRRKQRR